MTTLMIKDLARNEELSAKAMAGVHGGRRGLALDLSFELTKIDTDITKQVANVAAEQFNGNTIENAVQNGSGNAVFGGKFGGNVDAYTKIYQDVDQRNDIDVTQRA